jgi:Fur family ferric uptake transcriptional regulator
MAVPIEQLQNLLQKHSRSMTRPRAKVFEALQSGEPLTIQELILRCSPDIDRASVYRTVQLFERLGIVQRVQIGWKYRLELSSDFQLHHHHMHCVRCGAIIALPEDTLLEKRLHELASAQGFESQDHTIEVRGLCPACQNSPAIQS